MITEVIKSFWSVYFLASGTKHLIDGGSGGGFCQITVVFLMTDQVHSSDKGNFAGNDGVA